MDQAERLEVICDFMCFLDLESTREEIANAVVEFLAYPFARGIIVDYVTDSVLSEVLKRNGSCGIAGGSLIEGFHLYKSRSLNSHNDA